MSLYTEELIKEGIADTRAVDLDTAFSALHYAIAKLDNKNMRIFFSKTMNLRLREYAAINGAFDGEMYINKILSTRGGRHGKK